MNRFFALLGLLVLTFGGSYAVTYPLGPSASGVIDVTDLPANLISEGLSNLDKSGGSDNRARLQALVNRFKYQTDANPNLQTRILYFPNGTYRFSGGIIGVDVTPGNGGIILQGEERDNTILQLDNSATGFGDTLNPQKFISFFDSTWTNNAFYNCIEDLTIDTGDGNPGAIALGFYSNNTGHVRNLRIRTGGNGAEPGYVGLLTNESAGSSSPSGVGFIQGLLVEGFDYGIHTGSARQQGYTFEDITLSGQGTSGIYVNGSPAQFRRIQSTNTVPALTVEDIASHVVVLDSTFAGGASGNPAIDHNAGHLFVRDSIATGYGATINDLGVDITSDLSDDEYLSSGSQVIKQWSSTPSETIGLPVLETPLVPWDDDPADWYIIDPTLQIDDTAAFAAAMSSGKSTICVLPTDDNIRLGATIDIGPNVRRIIFQWNTIQPVGALFHSDPGQPLFRFGPSNHSAVLLEKLVGEYLGERKAFFIEHDSAQDLVLRDIFYGSGPLYRNTDNGTGRFFIEDVHLLPGAHPDDLENQEKGIVLKNQEAYFRGVNPEFFNPGITNDGGTLWIMGFKVGESAGPVVRSINNATTEILGGVMNMTHDVEPTALSASSAILEIDHSNVSAVLFERFEGVGSSGGLGWGKNVYAAVETRGTETRSLLNETASGVPRRPSQLGAMFALYTGYQFGAAISSLQNTVLEGAGTIDAFSVARGDADTSSPLTINYAVSGTAVAGVDYVALSGSVTIPIGASEAIIPLTVLDNAEDNLGLDLNLTLQTGVGYELGQVISATVTIIDDDYVIAAQPDVVLPAGGSTSTLVTLNNPTDSAQTVTVVAPSGDNYSYLTSDDAGGPSFDWTDISGTGNKILANTDDGSAVSRPIGFPFSYYGEEYTTVTVNANGYLDFDGETSPTWSNRDLSNPSRNIGNVIAPFWEDLNPSSANSDAVYYQTFNGDTFIVQWNDLLPYGNNAEENLVTFQVILKSDGTIIFQYFQMNAAADAYSYTIGLSNADVSQAVLVSHRQGSESENPNFAHPLMAIQFNPLNDWFGVSTNSVNVPAFGSQNMSMSYDASGLDGTYDQAAVRFVFSDPDIGDVLQPVSLTLTDDDPPVASNVSILGSVGVGESLGASYTYSDPEGDPEGATVIEWQRSDTEGGTYSTIATNQNYTLQAGDRGKWIRLRVTPVSTQIPTNGVSIESNPAGPVVDLTAFDGLPAGLVAYWPFDDGLDPTVDASGNGRHADLQSGTEFTHETSHGDAIQITGDGGAQSGNEHLITDDFTIAAWVKHDGPYTTATNEIILSKGWDLYLAVETVSADGKLRVQLKHSGGSVFNAHLNDAKTLIAPDTWTHVVALRDGDGFTFFINGVQTNPSWSGGATANPVDSNSVALTTGYNALASGTWWRGCLDEVQLYNHALLPEEVAQLYARSPDVKATWKEGVFASLPGGASHSDALDLANPDGDPYDNLSEFAFRLDPLVADGPEFIPSLELIEFDGADYFGISYLRRAGSGVGTTETGYTVDGITYTLERSVDLNTSPWDRGAGFMLETGVEDHLNGTETVTVRSTTPMGDQMQEFFRLILSD